MNIYLIARYGRREEMLAVSADLEALGHRVVSRWIREPHEDDDAQFNADPKARLGIGAYYAGRDLEDMECADCIAFTEEPDSPHGRGGRHMEAAWFGFQAYCARRRILVGPIENVFYALPAWERYPDWETCLAKLRQEGRRRGLA